ncbi:BTAD domain-containing putative transcriptional regulator [Lentzea sp. BCCO 10_0856]|uniref:BTAD domain-containing putative transcriptional regulator n=1 Tax=Lentzea miocenica TaxID=3095431 RepID=A0ABU4T3X2_9PSEU|nr:BTAD domain-containing putative transcriptional regulator [Lentzea sp. BCCO 10_0856]MDX8032868.1 BTAD domain-containing putative transcriptional regulator [Lentzea sp. BCCO 10_0856]
MRFRVLGPLDVSPGEVVGPRKRKVLTALLLNAGRVVSVDQLTAAVWDSEPPRTAARQIRNTTTSLRRDLVAAGAPDGVITAGGPGFVLDLAGCWFDLAEFDRLVVSDPAGALALWRGPALDGLGSAALAPAAEALDARRLATLELRIGADLDSGEDVLEEVRALVALHPYRETLVALLMRSYYLAGRQADALAAYQRLRDLLDAELGVVPSPAVRSLYEQILRQDLDTGVSGPRQLPPPSDLCGRSALMAEVVSALPVVVLTGQGGVGKSALAVRVAHDLAARYPGGQLYAKLLGTSAFEVLGRFLRALGVPPAEVPADLDERAAVYRSLLASRRVLVVLDDALDERQVRPLLPGYPGSAVLVTSRRSLAALREARHIVVPVLDLDDATEMLAESGDVSSARSLAVLCGRLPLALSVMAARLTRPDMTPARLLTRLVGQRALLDELAVGDLDVRGSIALSYRALSPAAALAFRRLGLLGGVTMPAWVLAAFADQPWEAGERLLDDLLSCHLAEPAGVDEAGQSRFFLHDLVHEFASELVVQESVADRRAAVTRLVHGLLALAATADDRLGHGTVLSHALIPGNAPGTALELASTRPFDWFEAEREVLVAVIQQAASLSLADEASELAVRTRSFFSVRQYFAEGEAVTRAVIDCLPGPDPRKLVNIRALFALYTQQDRNAELPALAAEAQAIAGQVGDPLGIAEARWQVAATAARFGQLFEAVAAFRVCAGEFATCGTPVHDALTRWGLGIALADLGLPEASVVLKSFLADPPSRLTSMGLKEYAELLIDAGRPGEAVETLEVARSAILEMDDRPGLAHLDVVHGYADFVAGRADVAVSRLRSALEVLREHRDPQGTAVALRRLGDVTGDRACWEEAAEIFRRISLPLELMRTLVRLGEPEGERLLAELGLPRASLRRSTPESRAAARNWGQG